MEPAQIKVALVGNPNCGKSTLFNALTGLHQKTGNFPGVTVDKKSGFFKSTGVEKNATYRVIDLPGIYSLYPKSIDEKVSFDVLFNKNDFDFPDILIAVVDASNVNRHLLLVSQLIDLKSKMILVLNMIDEARVSGIDIDVPKLENELGISVITVNARSGEGLEELKQKINSARIPTKEFMNEKEWRIAKNSTPETYENCLIKSEKAASTDSADFSQIEQIEFESKDILNRFHKLKNVVSETVRFSGKSKLISISNKIDRIVTSPILGYGIFLLVLFLVFQSIFYLAEFPMQWIESGFVHLGDIVSELIPEGKIRDLTVNGILAGLSGIVVFVPQIALLFGFIAILEDSGYMARVSFIMDKLMRRVGLNGRSVIPMMSGVACAVPAIMGARTISNVKERIITILITPFMSCSARLPVYTLLISLLVPENEEGGSIGNKGLYLLGLYLLGFVTAIWASYILKKIMKTKEKSFFIMELPVYRIPQWKNVFFSMYRKVSVFLWDAGKIIVAISIVLWFLSSYAPGEKFEEIENKYSNTETLSHSQKENIQAKIDSEKLEASYAGILGKTIEPVISPLGFDWKIGISLVTSFAAREVFVGTMATIYGTRDSENTSSIREKMKAEINPETNLPRYNDAVCISLLIFYVFAMQCMSTLAVVYRETASWKWPLTQLFMMTGIAYLSSLLIYQSLK